MPDLDYIQYAPYAALTLLPIGWTIARNTFFPAGKVALALELNTAAITQLQEELKEMRTERTGQFILSHEEARKYLHWHDNDGNVCRE